MATTNLNEPSSSPPAADHATPGVGELCELLDHLRAEVALLDAVGLHDVADQIEAYERLVRSVVYAAIRDLDNAA
jgi:hypothetical protein